MTFKRQPIFIRNYSQLSISPIRWLTLIAFEISNSLLLLLNLFVEGHFVGGESGTICIHRGQSLFSNSNWNSMLYTSSYKFCWVYQFQARITIRKKGHGIICEPQLLSLKPNYLQTFIGHLAFHILANSSKYHILQTVPLRVLMGMN